MSKYTKHLKNIHPVKIAHGNSKKYVFRSNEELPNSITQIAYGYFEPQNYCDKHSHPTMDEYFYFIEGEGTYFVGDEKIDIKPGLFLEIPAGTEHSLSASENGELKFVYWGVAK